MALVSKILEATLTAGSTTVTFTDSDIPNSLIRVFSSNSDIIPESRILSGNTLTVTYAPQSNNIDVAVEIVKQGLDIVDNVLSEDTDKALSAKQGYLLSAAIGDVSDGLSTLSETVNNLDIPDNITDLDDVTVTDIQSGQVLAWNGTKFVNVNQSGGGGNSDIYSTEETVIGKWIDNTNVYQRCFVLNTDSGTFNQYTWKEIPGIDTSNILAVIKCTAIQYDSAVPTARVNYDLTASTNRTAFNNHLAVMHYRNIALNLFAGTVIILKYIKIND